MIATYSLPTPPSLNGAYFNAPGKGRIATTRLKKWKVQAGWELQLQKPVRFDGEVNVEALIQRDRTNSDIDNKLKHLLDLLVTHQVIKDDKFVRSVKATWIPTGSGVACKVTIAEVVG